MPCLQPSLFPCFGIKDLADRVPEKIEAQHGNKDGETREKTLQEKLNGIAHIAPLVRPNDNENPGVIPDLITYLDILFEAQKETSKHTYDAMIQELKNLEAQSRSLVGSTGGVNTEEKFAEYNNYAKELRDVLGTYVPMLLRKEPYFKDVFYNQDAA